jgi:tRNA G18 (ribose-2'-O)-methylase SpoU
MHKTALGAETMVNFEHQETPNIKQLKDNGYRIVGLEQNDRSVELNKYQASQKIVLLLGEEVHGITDDLIAECDDILEIPMSGKKESFNVSVATGIALYQLTI